MSSKASSHAHVAVTPELVAHLARVSRLELSSDEEERLIRELEDVLSLFSHIASCDTTGVSPAFHPVALERKTRKDEARDVRTNHEGLDQDRVLRDVAHQRNGFFLGPRIL